MAFDLEAKDADPEIKNRIYEDKISWYELCAMINGKIGMTITINEIFNNEEAKKNFSCLYSYINDREE